MWPSLAQGPNPVAGYQAWQMIICESSLYGVCLHKCTCCSQVTVLISTNFLRKKALIIPSLPHIAWVLFIVVIIRLKQFLSLSAFPKLRGSWPDHTLFSKYSQFCYIIYLFFSCCSTSCKIYIKEINFKGFFLPTFELLNSNTTADFCFKKKRLKVTWSITSFVPNQKLMEFHCFTLLWL